jgi:lysozyme
MKTSSAGRAAIAQREGNILTAYKDSGGVLTIGVGHTSAAGPPKVKAGMRITAAESDAILARDLADVERTVNSKVKVPLTQSQFDALVSLVFNIGGGAFASSTLLRKLNAGDYDGAADQFLRWNKVKGRVIKGLTTRRIAERKQFLATSAAPAPAEAPEPVTAPEQPPKDNVRPEPPVASQKGWGARLLDWFLSWF